MNSPMNAVDLTTNVYIFLPLVSIVLNLFCIVISRYFVSKRYEYMGPINCLVFAVNIVLSMVIFLTRPVQIVYHGYVVTAFMMIHSVVWQYLYYLLLLTESYAIFCTLLTYIVLIIRYIKPIPTFKVLAYSSLGFLPIILLYLLKFYTNANEWSHLSEESHRKVTEAASKFLNHTLDNYCYVESNHFFYILEICFLLISAVSYVLSFVLFIIFERFMPNEKVLNAKLMFSKELRRATKASILLFLVGNAVPRATIHCLLILYPKLTSVYLIPFCLTDILVAILIPIIFLNGFYSKHIRRVVRRLIPTINVAVTPLGGTTDDDDPAHYNEFETTQ